MNKVALLLLFFSLPVFASGVSNCRVNLRSSDGMTSSSSVDAKAITATEGPFLQNAPIANSCPGMIGRAISDTETDVFYISRAEKLTNKTVCYYNTNFRKGTAIALTCDAN